MLLGYYPLLPNLIDDLPEVLAAIRKTGCMTALDAAGDGGEMAPLEPVLPHLDLYVPSLAEAQHQTGEEDPQKIIAAYRERGRRGDAGRKTWQPRGDSEPQAGRVRRRGDHQAAGRGGRYDWRRRLLFGRTTRGAVARDVAGRCGATRLGDRGLLRDAARRDGGDSRASTKRRSWRGCKGIR
jgi:hypothetical protein